MLNFSDEEKSVLRQLHRSSAWHLIVKIADEIKNQEIQHGYNRTTNVHDSHAISALGAARGIDTFVSFIDSAMDKYTKE